MDDGLGYAVFADYDRSGENADTPVNHPTGISRIELRFLSENNNFMYVVYLQMLLKQALEFADYEDMLGLKYTQFVTGIYDYNTMRAVEWYQKRNNLSVDGVAGPSTIESLCNDSLRILKE